jgi:hypothetical protein
MTFPLKTLLGLVGCVMIPNDTCSNKMWGTVLLIKDEKS